MATMTVRLGSESVVNFHKALTRGTLPFKNAAFGNGDTNYS